MNTFIQQGFSKSDRNTVLTISNKYHYFGLSLHREGEKKISFHKNVKQRTLMIVIRNVS